MAELKRQDAQVALADAGGVLHGEQAVAELKQVPADEGLLPLVAVLHGEKAVAESKHVARAQVEDVVLLLSTASRPWPN